MDETVVLVEYRARSGAEKALLARMTAVVAQVRAREPECSGIRILQNADDPQRITLVEEWSDRAQFEGPHLQQPHIQAFIDEVTQLLEGPPTISVWGASPAWSRRVSMRPR